MISSLSQLGILSKSEFWHWVNIIIWAAFDEYKDQSIKITVFKVPISIKIWKLEAAIKILVGPRKE